MQILRIKDILHRTGHRSRTTIHTLVEHGLFPQPIHIGPRSTGWLATEVDTIIKAQAAGKSGEQIKALVASLHAKRTAE